MILTSHPMAPKSRAPISYIGVLVSAGAKIPIVPFEFSPPLDVVNRNLLQTEEVPRLAKGERHARSKRTTTARDVTAATFPVKAISINFSMISSYLQRMDKSPCLLLRIESHSALRSTSSSFIQQYIVFVVMLKCFASAVTDSNSRSDFGVAMNCATVS